jgi:hypothetical protein
MYFFKLFTNKVTDRRSCIFKISAGRDFLSVATFPSIQTDYLREFYSDEMESTTNWPTFSFHCQHSCAESAIETKSNQPTFTKEKIVLVAGGCLYSNMK